MIFFFKNDSFYKVHRFVNDDPLLTLVNIFINEKISKTIVFLRQSYTKRLLIVFIKKNVSKTIVIRFLKDQNEWVVFKNDSFFRKRNDRF